MKHWLFNRIVVRYIWHRKSYALVQRWLVQLSYTTPHFMPSASWLSSVEIIYYPHIVVIMIRINARQCARMHAKRERREIERVWCCMYSVDYVCTHMCKMTVMHLACSLHIDNNTTDLYILRLWLRNFLYQICLGNSLNGAIRNLTWGQHQT